MLVFKRRFKNVSRVSAIYAQPNNVRKVHLPSRPALRHHQNTPIPELRPRSIPPFLHPFQMSPPLYLPDHSNIGSRAVWIVFSATVAQLLLKTRILHGKTEHLFLPLPFNLQRPVAILSLTFICASHTLKIPFSPSLPPSSAIFILITFIHTLLPTLR